MPLRFWLYLFLNVIVIIVFTFVAVLSLLPSNHWFFSTVPSYSGWVFNVLFFGFMLLDRVIERKIKKVDSEADADGNKAMLKRYKIIDRITTGFVCLFLVCIAIRWVRSWFP
jgi:hypothetical protein